eukprot:2925007-Rhodomonas_salina.3
MQYEWEWSKIIFDFDCLFAKSSPPAGWSASFPSQKPGELPDLLSQQRSNGRAAQRVCVTSDLWSASLEVEVQAEK